jgi:glutamate-1-semialdehyde 2,1-aminomutase
MDKNQALYAKAKKIIPGGTQLLSKRPELHLPGLWPTYYKKAKGCEVWDLNGRKFSDVSFMGIGSCILGYADADVNRAVAKAVAQGSMTTLNCPEEVELAQLLCEIHPWAKMARFMRTGGEAMSVAVRIGRAFTRKEIVLLCGYHGWHDWYLSANLAAEQSLDGHLLPGLKPLGVPRSLQGTVVTFQYNDLDGFLKLFEQYRDRVAAVVMEPLRNVFPAKDFLRTIRRKTSEAGAVLIFDEITSGWRLNAGGAHLKLGVDPDVAVFAKAISNGYPMAAVIGRSKIMSAAQDTFISSTYWTERIGPTAALATIRKLKKMNVAARLSRVGRRAKEGWQRAAQRHGLNIHVSGIDPLAHFELKDADGLVLKTLFIQEMLAQGFMATNGLYASWAHTDAVMKRYLQAVDRAFGKIAKAVKSGDPAKALKGPVCQQGFKRLT